MAIRPGRFGPFLACTGYPECKTTRRLVQGTRKARQPDELLDEKCPECGSQLVKKHGQYGEFTGCTAYPKCKYIRSKTLGIACPKCGAPFIVEKRSKFGTVRACLKEGCDWGAPVPAAEPAEAEVSTAAKN